MSHRRQFPPRSILNTVAACTMLALATVGAPARAASPAPALDLGAYKGKVVYLDFWASWCGPCQKSFPYMDELAAEYGRDGLVVIAVNLDHSAAQAANFLRAVGTRNVQIVYDPTGAIATAYQVKDMPTSILIGHDGRVRYRHSGFFPAQTADYQAHVAELIHER